VELWYRPPLSMADLPPDVQTYHCICNSLLLASTHKLSNLPRRQGSSLDEALILPLPSAPLIRSPSPALEDGQEGESETRSRDLPSEGYTILLGLLQDKKVTTIRREDGFEKRVLSRCSRCNLVVGYELQEDGSAMDVDSQNGKGKDAAWFAGKVMYLLPGGIMSTGVMVEDKKLSEDDVAIQIKSGGVATFE
jgi:hypothetical protein